MPKQKEFEEMTANIQKYLDNIDQLQIRPATKDAIKAVRPSVKTYIEQGTNIVETALSKGYAPALTVMPKFIESFEVLEGDMGKLGDLIQEDAKASREQGASHAKTFSILQSRSIVPETFARHGEAERPVEPVDVGEQADDRAPRQRGDEAHDRRHHQPREPLPLELGMNGDVGDLHVQPVADHAAHADQPLAVTDRHGVERAGSAAAAAVRSMADKTRGDAQVAELVDGGDGLDHLEHPVTLRASEVGRSRARRPGGRRCRPPGAAAAPPPAGWATRSR